MPIIARIAIHPQTLALQAQAQVLAQQLHLPLIQAQDDLTHYDYLLILTPTYLGLQKTNTPTLPLYVNFCAEKMAYRCQHASLRKEIIARALGLKRNTQLKIVDATAGLGGDSFILAHLGFEVQLLERSLIIHTLLTDGLQRALQNPLLAPTVHRLSLLNIDAIIWLEQLNPQAYPDIIYIDPMFPERRKSALVKKEMRILHDVIGNDSDASRLLKTALACATKRVVVKRPRLATNLAGLSPSFCLTGKSSRFDIYLV